MHWLALFYVFLVVEDEGKQLVLPRDEVIEEGLKGVADGELAVGDGTDEGGGLEEEVQEVIVFLYARAADGVIGQRFILVDSAGQFIDSL